jgi:hypothetical protein
MCRQHTRCLSVIGLLVLFSSANGQAFAYERNVFSSMDGEYRHMSQEELSTAIFLLEDRHGRFSPHLYKPTFRQAVNFQRKGNHAAAVNAFRRCQHLLHRADGVYSPSQLESLDGLILSHLALWDLVTVDKFQLFRFEVAARHDAFDADERHQARSILAVTTACLFRTSRQHYPSTLMNR